jgi:hypothetical protein
MNFTYLIRIIIIILHRYKYGKTNYELYSKIKIKII